MVDKGKISIPIVIRKTYPEETCADEMKKLSQRYSFFFLIGILALIAIVLGKSPSHKCKGGIDRSTGVCAVILPLEKSPI